MGARRNLYLVWDCSYCRRCLGSAAGDLCLPQSPLGPGAPLASFPGEPPSWTAACSELTLAFPGRGRGCPEPAVPVQASPAPRGAPILTGHSKLRSSESTWQRDINCWVLSTHSRQDPFPRSNHWASGPQVPFLYDFPEVHQTRWMLDVWLPSLHRSSRSL